jgi:hypothetical protein
LGGFYSMQFTSIKVYWLFAVLLIAFTACTAPQSIIPAEQGKVHITIAALNPPESVKWFEVILKPSNAEGYTAKLSSDAVRERRVALEAQKVVRRLSITGLREMTTLAVDFDNVLDDVWCDDTKSGWRI